MRIGQAIDCVYQNIELKYESDNFTVFYSGGTNSIVIKNKHTGLIYSSLHGEFGSESFRLMKKPVSFIDAVKSGKDFKCHCLYLPVKDRGRTYNLNAFITSLAMHIPNPEEIKNTILEGNFYIQEDD